MRITIDNVCICEGDEKSEYPDSFSSSLQRNVQIKETLRGTNAQPIGRGNALRRISFRVTREHADHRTALEWAVAHEAEIPENGDVKFVLQADGESVYWFHDCQVEATQLDPIIGSTTVHSYSLVGGAFNQTQPV
jgi:hypothetical protein